MAFQTTYQPSLKGKCEPGRPLRPPPAVLTRQCADIEDTSRWTFLMETERLQRSCFQVDSHATVPWYLWYFIFWVLAYIHAFSGKLTPQRLSGLEVLQGSLYTKTPPSFQHPENMEIQAAGTFSYWAALEIRPSFKVSTLLSLRQRSVPYVLKHLAAVPILPSTWDVVKEFQMEMKAELS